MERAAARDLDACRAILARGSKSFAAASRLLPRRVREPAAVFYAFCRVVDDAVDEAPPRLARNALDRFRGRLDRVFVDRPNDDAIDRALARVVSERALPREPFEAVLDGFAWDLEGRSYERVEDLYAYGARVAGAVGVVMTYLMERREPRTLARASELGVAMQLTNVARDVGEDARRGRIYLPRAWLDAEGVDAARLLEDPKPSEGVARVVARLVEDAERLYARSEVGIDALPRDCRAAIRAARWIYADIHRVIARRGYDTISRRAVVSAPRKLWLLARALLPALGGGRRVAEAAAPPLEEIRFLLPAAPSP
ncbi:MAG: phytoene/squalene synthase family protein [Polyangiaceae bacterium]